LHTDVDETEQVIASLFPIDNCRVLANKLLLLKSPNASVCGRRREIDFPRQFHIGQTGRLNLGVKARAVGEETFDWISRWVPKPATQWKGHVECFAGKSSRLMCTLLMHWEEGYEHPWIVLTDLSPQEAEVSWYGGLKRATRTSNADCGGSIRASCSTPAALSGSGWPWPLLNCGR
jgi:hypothetical protein